MKGLSDFCARMTDGVDSHVLYVYLKYTRDVSLLLKQSIRINRRFNHETACILCHGSAIILTIKLKFSLSIFWNTCTYSVYVKTKKELHYNRFVDPNILGAARLVHSDLRIY